MTQDPDYKLFSVTVAGVRHHAHYELQDGFVTVEVRETDGATFGTDQLPVGVSPVAHARAILREILTTPDDRF